MVPVTTNENILKNHENDIRCVHFTYVFWGQNDPTETTETGLQVQAVDPLNTTLRL